MNYSSHLLVHFYGIDLTDTLSLRPRRRFSALSVLVVVRWKNVPHSLKQNSFFFKFATTVQTGSLIHCNRQELFYLVD